MCTRKTKLARLGYYEPHRTTILSTKRGGGGCPKPFHDGSNKVKSCNAEMTRAQICQAMLDASHSFMEKGYYSVTQNNCKTFRVDFMNNMMTNNGC